MKKVKKAVSVLLISALVATVALNRLPQGIIYVKAENMNMGKVLVSNAAEQPEAAIQRVNNSSIDNSVNSNIPISGASVMMDNQKSITTSNINYNNDPAAISGGGVLLGNHALNNENVTKGNVTEVKISSKEMDVTVDKDFPRVIKYEMKTGSVRGKIFYGQTKQLDTITINGIDVKPSAITSGVETDKISYIVNLNNSSDPNNSLDAVIECEIGVYNNTLGFKITDIKVNSGIIKTIEIKDHSLISIRSDQTGATLSGANMSTNTHVSGDRTVVVDQNLNVAAEAKKGYMYAFLSNSELSAGLWSNSENGITNEWQRVTAVAEDGSGYKTMGLQSTYWTFQNTYNDRCEDGTIEYLNGANSDGKTLIEISELPECKVAICGDENGDSSIDWQDGAIAYRTIMNNPVGSHKVPDLVAYRIAMNVGSQAQNPFLMTLDHVKKIALNTNGLGQSILLSGYEIEGYHSGHLDYTDIGQRIGGTEDMKALLEKGKKYGAAFGINVNVSEVFPESKNFTESILRINSGAYDYGWSGIDQGFYIDALYDLRNGRVDYWKDLYDILGGKSNILDFIYVDGWGNGQSGDNGTWASRQLAKEITAHGWRLAGDWGDTNEYDSTFQYRAVDPAYGTYQKQGINSNIAKFIRNHQKDTWVANYPSYGGEADAPLLGAYNMKGFEGWQGGSNYADYIYNLFEVNLPSKLVQHFSVMDWEEGTPVTMTDQGETYKWTPGMKAELQTEDLSHSLVITRNSNDYANDKEKYRTRTMKYDGKKIYEGMEGNTTYLIPWNWDQNGNSLPAGAEKLYHWNTKGGTTTWEVPAGWTTSAKVYRLDDLGKQDMQTVSITNGKITLTANAKTPYVLLKNEQPNETMTWSDGMKIVDSGFNSGSLKPWTIAGTGKPEEAIITKSQGSNPMLKIENNPNKVSVSQKLTGLKPNTKYAAYVGVDNRSNSKASLSVTGGTKAVSTYTQKSIARSYIKAYAHNTSKSTATAGDTSYFQNMYVFFETGSDVSNVTLTLAKEAGNGAVYFDDVRICENNSTHNPDSETFTQDFENVSQGIYPFVIGNVEEVEDNRTHLSEKNAPYTQRGWNNKKVNDVIDGNWSLKTSGLTGRDRLVYQTIPQNYRFEPGAVYEVTFDYEAGSDGTYAFAVGQGDYLNADGTIQQKVDLKSTLNETAGKGTFTTKITADKSGQGWIGIYSTTKASTPDETGLSDKEIYFRGYSDFMLDNLSIKKLSNGSGSSNPDSGSSSSGSSSSGGSVNKPEEKVEETTEQKTVTTVAVEKKEDGSTSTTYNIETTIKATGEIIKTTVVKEELKSGEKKLTIAASGTDSKVSVKGTVTVEKDGKAATDFDITSGKETAEKEGNVSEIMIDLNSNEVKEVSSAISKALDNSENVEINLSFTIPKEKAVESIKEKENKNVIVSVILPDTTTKYDMDHIILPKEVLNAAKSNNKNITIKIKNANQKANVSWSFTASLLKSGKTKAKDINLLVEAKTVNQLDANYKVLKSILKKDKSNSEKNSMLISFREKSKLPAAAEVTIPLNGKFKAGKSVYLLTMDTKTKKLMYLPDNKYVVNKDGTLTIHISRGMDYVLVPATPDAKTGVSLINQVTIKTSAKIIASGKTAKVTIQLPESMKKVTSFSKTIKDKTVAEAKITYKSSNSAVASVDKSGNIVGKKKGKVIIHTTITLKNGSKKTVKNSITIKS